MSQHESNSTPDFMSGPALRVDPANEEVHPHDPAVPLWSESWYLDAISDDGTLGVYARLGDTRNRGVSMVSVALVRPGHPPIIVNDERAPLPTREGRLHTIAATDYTATFDVPAPVQTSRVTFAGTARTFADDGAILRDEPGTPTPLAFDLTWATAGVDYQWKITTRYEIPCRVTGTITLDGETFTFAGDGQRDHSWGDRDWWGSEWMWSAFRLDADTLLHGVNMRGTDWMFGYHQQGGTLTELSAGSSAQTYDGNGTMTEASITFAHPSPDQDSLHVTVRPLAYGNLRLVSDAGQVAHFVRAMAEFEAADGRVGRGWVEWEMVIKD